MKYILLILLLIFCLRLNSESIIIPPEAKWWIYEFEKNGISINADSFKVVSEEYVELEKDEKTIYKYYPIFTQWNNSATFFLYLDHGDELEFSKNSKYDIYADIDSNLLLCDATKKIIFRDQFGAEEWLSCAYWLTENELIGLGIEFQNKYFNLVIKNYSILSGKIRVVKYMSKNQYSNFDRNKMKINWFEFRNDLFNNK